MSLGDGPPFAPAVLCGNSVAKCKQDRRLWIWIYPWISTQKSVDMDMDMDGKFHIHGKPGIRGVPDGSLLARKNGPFSIRCWCVPRTPKSVLVKNIASPTLGNSTCPC